ncbi:MULTISPECIES: hypothetical protein [Kitasatospora]|uniref:hypothetical protein n=1 Tax=Kitasatospora TaxID=2063 RepID=UPI0031CED8DD
MKLRRFVVDVGPVPGSATAVLPAARPGRRIGPANAVAPRLDELTDGAGAVADALDAAATIGLTRIDDGPRRFIVVLPEDGGRPLVARGKRGLLS